MEVSFSGTFLSALTGVAYSAFYLLNKKTAPSGKPLLVIFWIFAAHLPLYLIWALIAAPLHVTPAYILPGFGVLVVTIAGNMLTIRALSLSPFSLMVPVLGLSPVFTTLIGIPLLGEWPSGMQWMGIILAVIGVFWLYAPPERPWDIFSFWSGFVHERGAASMALAALMWASCSPFDKLALRQADPAFHALFVFTGFVVFLALWLARKGEWREQRIERKYWPLLALTGLVGGTSYLLTLLSLQHAPAGPFEAIKRVTSQIVALVVGYALFHEPVTKPKLIGLGLLSIGVPLIVI